MNLICFKELVAERNKLMADMQVPDIIIADIDRDKNIHTLNTINAIISDTIVALLERIAVLESK